MSYKRVLLKFSGEQLAGKQDSGIYAEFVSWLANEVKKVIEAKIQVVIVVGGGNFARGAQLAGSGIKTTTAHQIATLATVMNALALRDIFESKGVSASCMSNLFAEQVIESSSTIKCNDALQSGKVLIIGGGTGRPYFTSDTGAVNIALELNCEVVLKATKVDGVFDSDPELNPDAIKLENISAEEAVSNPNIKVMDKAAMGMAYEHRVPIIVFDAMKPDNIVKAATGQPVGTLIKPAE